MAPHYSLLLFHLHLIKAPLVEIFLPILISAIQVLLGGRMASIVCLMIDLTDTILLSAVVDAERAIA